MRFIKPIIILIILGLIGLFIQQNMATFNALHTFELSLYFGQPMKWTLSVCSLLAISLVVGLILGILIMFKPYMGSRRKLAEERQAKPSQ